VERPIPPTFDFGNLTVFDTNPLENSSLLSEKLEERESHLKNTTRDNVQVLINQILQLPVKRTTESNNSSSNQDSAMVLFALPEPTSELPREKPIPKPKAPTKWELFAAKKGIKKRANDGKLVFDEASGKWVPKWGYKGQNKVLDNQWLVEVDDKKHTGEKELIDPRTLNRQERKKLVKKNQIQQEKNAKRALG